MYNSFVKTVTVAVAVAVIAGCATAPPKRPDDACRIFKEKSGWYKHTRKAAKKYKVHAPLLLAIMRQESAFDSDAKPPRKRFLGIPTRRPSSAFGYAQALDGTWDLYEKSTGRRFAQRDDFADAMDFIAWYVAQSRRKLGIKANDGYRNYLAYHEGWGGYKSGTYKRKKWLLKVAQKVNRQSKKYHAQLTLCGYEFR